MLVSLLLFGVVAGVFAPGLRNDFVNYDDPGYVTENPYVQRGLTLANLRWALASGAAANWHPLTWLSHMADCTLFGLQPAGHHLTSVLLHACNAGLLFLGLHRMTRATGRSFLVALLFGVHPLRVESVVWVAERKDVLSGLFFLLTILAYAQYLRTSRVPGRKSRRYYVAAVGAFALGLMSKPMLVTLPCVLLLLDWWPLQRFAPAATAASSSPARVMRELAWEKTPFFLLAAASSVVTYAVQQSHGAVVQVHAISLGDRTANMLVSYFRYLAKAVWPADLALPYPYPPHWPGPMVLLAGAGLALGTGGAVALRRRHPYLLTGWLWFLGTLVPVIGLVQVGAQAMADRYTYLPLVGLLVMLVWGLNEWGKRGRHTRWALPVAGGVAALLCALRTQRQISYWKDSESLSRHAIAVTRNNAVALENLGRALGEKGQVDEAIEQYRAALRLNPQDGIAYNGLAVMLMEKRDFEAAANQLRTALELNPDDAFAHGNLGVILAGRGELDEALRHLEQAARLQPDDAGVRNNLAGVLAARGRFAEAIPHYRAAIALKPNYAKARNNLGVALVRTGELDQAIEQFREAVRLQPGFTPAQEQLKAALDLKANPKAASSPVQ